METSALHARVNMWLNALASHPREQMSLFVQDFRSLSELGHIQPDRVLCDEDGEPTLVVINTKTALNELKIRHNFQSLVDVENNLKEHANASNV